MNFKQFTPFTQIILPTSSYFPENQEYPQIAHEKLAFFEQLRVTAPNSYSKIAEDIPVLASLSFANLFQRDGTLEKIEKWINLKNYSLLRIKGDKNGYLYERYRVSYDQNQIGITGFKSDKISALEEAIRIALKHFEEIE
jgi:hypothetical protein